VPDILLNIFIEFYSVPELFMELVQSSPVVFGWNFYCNSMSKFP